MRKHGKSESRREYDLSVGGKAAHKRAWDKYVAAGKRVVYTNAKLSEDPQFAIQFRLRKRIYRAIKKGYKAGSAVRDLGCSIEEAKGYWESLPTWNPEWSWADWGKLFQMDHIRPLGLFDMTDREQFVQAVHYTNLQPLSIEAHLKKSGAEYSVIMAGRL